MPNDIQTLWTVGEVAELSRVSIRTLHHYDDLGLLKPSERSEANYRLYTAGDLEQLYRILTWRELGFPLGEIGRLLGADAAEQRRALELRSALLGEQLRQTERQLRAVTSLLQPSRLGEGAWNVNKEELKEIFEGFDHSEYEAEVQERWGDTAAYRQSEERTRNYTKADWEQLKAEADALNARYLALLDAGIPADSPQAAAVAEAHRAHFHKWFYDCSPEMLRGVSNLWVQDPRFTKNIDKGRSGLAAYQYAAVQAWAGKEG
ncbi:HTH-type transcriptional activator TipA [Deinococcus xinjiangensis]|uniref:HTH-type transcriptional activator TipA n=1 Tax=Deinococcus xinjiangensis TaxID=457454 RepID=A0ABP9VIU9_9DEIO